MKSQRHASIVEWSARAGIVLSMILAAAFNLAGASHLLPIEDLHTLLAIAARLANILFLVLIAATALTRLAPIRKAKGIEPRVSALLGSFLSFSLAALPKAELSAPLSILSTALIIVGSVLSFIVLRWLGKSFSIHAEARRLVTSGPYRYVRHPLYICEGLSQIGIGLQVISPWAVALLLVVALLQFRRMQNEEGVLLSAFPEYRDYAARTPRIIPVFLRAPAA